MADTSEVEISVNPNDADYLNKNLFECSPQIASGRKIRFRQNAAIEAGGLVIKANKSIIDAQVKTQLEECSEMLHRLLKHQ